MDVELRMREWNKKNYCRANIAFIHTKNEVLIFRSVNNIVIAPASTGKESNKSKVVITTGHTNKGIRSKAIPVDRILRTTVIKFTDPKIEEISAKWREKIAK